MINKPPKTRVLQMNVALRETLAFSTQRSIPLLPALQSNSPPPKHTSLFPLVDLVRDSHSAMLVAPYLLAHEGAVTIV